MKRYPFAIICAILLALLALCSGCENQIDMPSGIAWFKLKDQPLARLVPPGASDGWKAENAVLEAVVVGNSGAHVECSFEIPQEVSCLVPILTEQADVCLRVRFDLFYSSVHSVPRRISLPDPEWSGIGRFGFVGLGAADSRVVSEVVSGDRCGCSANEQWIMVRNAGGDAPEQLLK